MRGDGAGCPGWRTGALVLGLLVLRGERFTYRQYVRLGLALAGVYLLIGPSGRVDLDDPRSHGKTEDGGRWTGNPVHDGRHVVVRPEQDGDQGGDAHECFKRTERRLHARRMGRRGDQVNKQSQGPGDEPEYQHQQHDGDPDG